MKAFLSAIIVVAAVGAASYTVLNTSMQQTSEHKFATSSVRLPAGH